MKNNRYEIPYEVFLWILITFLGECFYWLELLMLLALPPLESLSHYYHYYFPGRTLALLMAYQGYNITVSVPGVHVPAIQGCGQIHWC